MLNIVNIIKKGFKSLLLNRRMVRRYKETPVGTGYYSLRHNKSRAGISYTKLVKTNKG